MNEPFVLYRKGRYVSLFYFVCVMSMRVHEEKRKQKKCQLWVSISIEHSICVVCSIKHLCYSVNSNLFLFLFRDENRIFIFARKLVVGGLFLMLNRHHTNLKYILYIQPKNTMHTNGGDDERYVRINKCTRHADTCTHLTREKENDR